MKKNLRMFRRAKIKIKKIKNKNIFMTIKNFIKWIKSICIKI